VPGVVVEKLNAAIGAALADLGVVERLKALGVSAKASSPEQFGGLIADETQKWRKVIADARISVD
jgi:tripartite-type tricarboxylate transporter receptor subunit TctC